MKYFFKIFSVAIFSVAIIMLTTACENDLFTLPTTQSKSESNSSQTEKFNVDAMYGKWRLVSGRMYIYLDDELVDEYDPDKLAEDDEHIIIEFFKEGYMTDITDDDIQYFRMEGDNMILLNEDGSVVDEDDFDVKIDFDENGNLIMDMKMTRIDDKGSVYVENMIYIFERLNSTSEN